MCKFQFRSRSVSYILCLLLVAGWLGIFPAAVQPAGLDGLKIGVVHLNTAINRSVAGARSKKILLASKSQKENELKARESELKKSKADLKNNIMLTDEARSRKEKELREQEIRLRREFQQAQRDLQSRERKLTESIFIELRTIIQNIAEEENFDLILERNASQVILYSRKNFIDITDKVIEQYDKFQQSN